MKCLNKGIYCDTTSTQYGTDRKKGAEISQIKLKPSYCLLIQIPFQMQTDMQVHSCMIELVTQNINIILGEISLILYSLTREKSHKAHTFTQTAKQRQTPCRHRGQACRQE